MKANKQGVLRAIAVCSGAVLFLLTQGCEPPSEEEMEAYWEADGDADTSLAEAETEFYGETGWITNSKADSASTEKKKGAKSKSLSLYHTNRRPLIGNESVGHGTPQPWNPTDPNKESSEDDN